MKQRDRILAGLLFCLSPLLWPQQSPPAGARDVQSTSAPVPNDAQPGLIHLDVLVADSSGKPVSGLGREDFTLLDNGEPAKILSFQAFDGGRAKADPPTQVLFVIDTMDEPEALARSERVAVESYLEQNGGRLAHPTSVMLLSDLGFWTLSHPSNDGRALAAELRHNHLRLIRGFSNADSLANFALKSMGQIATRERRVGGRKLLLWVGPGLGIGTGNGLHGSTEKGSPDLFYTVRWFNTLLREARVVLYSFSVGERDAGTYLWDGFVRAPESMQQTRLAHLDRKVMAIQSGGRVVDQRYDLLTQIKRCVAEADVFYSLTFDPSHAEHMNELHSLRVQVDKQAETARTNTSYYDQPYYAVEGYPPVQRVTVAQLEGMLETLQKKPDAELARQLSTLELTERLSGAKLAAWTARLRGSKVRQALIALADASAFAPPPADEIPADAPPDSTAQRQIVAQSGAYLADTLTRLPDLLATRTIVRYQEDVHYDGETSEIAFEPMRVTGNSKTKVRYSHGVELVNEEQRPPRTPSRGAPMLETYGTFGPMLGGILQAVTRDDALTWDRWEANGNRRAAVFRFAIPQERSRYDIAICCLPDGDGTRAFEEYVGYSGEIVIDPESGAILRLEYQAGLRSTTPLASSAVVIEYGPVEIGGKTYICPMHSISKMRARSVEDLAEWDESFATYGPYATMLNDMRFTNYHVFRSESRILP